MAEYDAGYFYAQVKHGRWILEAEVWHGPGDVAHIRIDLEHLWQMVLKAEDSKKGVCRRGPMQVRRPGWIRKRLC